MKSVVPGLAKGPFICEAADPPETDPALVNDKRPFGVAEVYTIPSVSVKTPGTVTSFERVTPVALVLLIVKAPNVVVELPAIVCAELPLKMIVLVLAVKVPLLLMLPAIFNKALFTVKEAPL